MLEQERQEIDDIDQQLVDLLVQRLAVSEKIATVKLNHHMPLLDQKREQLVYQRVAAQTPADKQPYLKTLFTDIMLVSKQYQAKLMKAWQDEHETTNQ